MSAELLNREHAQDREGGPGWRSAAGLAWQPQCRLPVRTGRREIIRAILTSEGKHAGIKHRLDEMVDLVPDENPLKPMLRAIEELAAYATAYRYPTSSGRIPAAPDGSEIEALARNIESALGDAVAQFDVDLARKGSPAGRPGPIR